MRTNIELNDELVEEAFHYTSVTTKRELVEIALREFINHHKRRDIKELRGKVKLHSDYDYKKNRTNK